MTNEQRSYLIKALTIGWTVRKEFYGENDDRSCPIYEYCWDFWLKGVLPDGKLIRIQTNDPDLPDLFFDDCYVKGEQEKMLPKVDKKLMELLYQHRDAINKLIKEIEND